jgi:hypothetical protein
MRVIEILTFALLAGSDETAFLAADYRVQTEFIPNLPGFVRRTTARGENGGWLVLTLWRTAADADVAAALATDDAIMQAFTAFIDPTTVTTSRYEPLD